MSRKSISIAKTAPCLLTALFCSFCFAGIDKTKYITIDEIRPGMDAVCLTVYKGVEIEKFNLKVVDVVRDIMPGKNAILVMGTDERFIHTGPVGGCSGSPVYIDNRLAGALAFGWNFSKDPLYGVTPIEEMLSVGEYNRQQETPFAMKLDFANPIDLAKAYDQTINCIRSASSRGEPVESAAAGSISMLPCPLAASLPQNSLDEFADVFKSLGFLPVSAAGNTGRLSKYNDIPMAPGGIITLPLVDGDIEVSVGGTITEVVGDKVYAFGHSFLGQGPINLPMGTGYVHTVVASIFRSFKFIQPIDIKGAIYADQSTAIAGTIGKKAEMIPMRLTIDRFNDEKTRTYNCQVASHRYFTPLLAGICLSGAATTLGNLPADHTIQYKTHIGIKDYEPIHLENFSSSAKLEECLADNIGALSLVMNNPYIRPEITSLDFEVKILPKTQVSHIWSFDISNTTVKPGQTITASITLESYLTGHKNYKTQLTIPDNIQPGEYKLILSGTADYMDFAVKTAPYKYIPENLPSLISIINDIANTRRNELHLVLALPAGGIAIETAQLLDLPLSKTVLLDDKKRSITTIPAAQWLEKTIPVDTIVIDSRTLDITVEEQ